MGARLGFLTPDRPSPEERALEAEILQGYADRHRGAGHRPDTIAGERANQLAFRVFAGRPLWRWRPADVDRYSAQLCAHDYARTTLRKKQGAIRRLLDYARDPAYDYDERCYALTGARIPQICTRENTLRHQFAAPTSKRRRFTDPELEALFDRQRAFAGEAERDMDRHSRELHYTVAWLTLATGFRETDVAMLDLGDVAPALTPEVAAFSPYEDLETRFAKSHDGGPQRRRSVPATYYFRHAFACLEWYLREVRPELAQSDSPPALFLNTKGQRIRADSLAHAFADMRDRAKLSADLTLHCLRHTFETKLHESGLAISITSKLLGHAHESTTQIYDHIADEWIRAQVFEFNRRLIAQSLRCRDLTGACAR